MKNYINYSDQELTEYLRQGDQAAYTEIYNRYDRLLYLFAYKRLGNREEVKDTVHEVLLSLWQNHENVTLTYTLSTYLHAAVRNKILDLLSRKQVSTRYIDSFKNFIEPGYDATDHLIRHKELSAIIEKEVQALPKKMREVFDLSRKSNYTRKEIAEELGLSEQTVKSHMQHALKILKVKLGSMFALLFIIYP